MPFFRSISSQTSHGPLTGIALLAFVLTAPAVQAQVAGYDTSLRSIGPATINQASFDLRARSPIQSIGPSSLENRGNTVPAIYDPEQGRFVSALGNSRGAIAVVSTGVVSVVMTQQGGVALTGSASTGVLIRSEANPPPGPSVTSPQIITMPGSNR